MQLFMPLLALLLLSLLSCATMGTNRYTKRDAATNAVASEEQGKSEANAHAPQKQRRPLFASRSTAPRQPAVYAVDEQTYRFQRSQKDVWDSVIAVLLKNYSLSIVDSNSGIVTTEWDKFLLHNSYYRNKLSIRVQAIQGNLTELTVHNTVEKLEPSPVTPGSGNLWLPAKDEANELHRVVQNIAVVMHLDPPANVKTRFARSHD